MNEEQQVTLTIDGQTTTVPPDTTIWEAAQQLGITLPVLCHDPRLPPVGVCRLCLVDLGERTLAAACVRTCAGGMRVRTDSEEIGRHRRMLLQLLLSEQPDTSLREQTTGDDQLYALAREAEPGDTDLLDWRESEGTVGRGEDASSPVIRVDHQACVLCDRCIRGCNALQHNHVLTRSGKGYATRIAFDLDAPMGESSCVSCGECVAVCPTGALTHAVLHRATAPDGTETGSTERV